MPYFGLGLHVMIALLGAIHAVRTGRQMYWLLIPFSFPRLGGVVNLHRESQTWQHQLYREVLI